MFELQSYLARIGLPTEPTPSLAQLHRAHVTRIPFENLDPLVGLAVSLAPDAVAAKLVHGGRGGYCFEHNVLFMHALEALGARVEPMLARVRNGRRREPAPPLTHLLLRVRHAGEVWHADVGFGGGGLLEPIPFGPGGPYEQSGWRLRVVQEGAALVLQTDAEDGWNDLYAFLPEPVPAADIELGNWYTSTHPQSRFATGLLVTRTAADGTRTTLTNFGGELTLGLHTPAGTTREPVAREDVPGLLERGFGLRMPELPED